MTSVPPARLREVSALIEETQALPPRERAYRLAQRTPDPVLRTEISRLLAAHERADGTVGPIEPAEVAELLRAAAPIDHRIGRYDLVRLIRTGRFGVTYLATQDDGNPVAVKLLLGLLAADEQARALLVRETRAIAELGHPNIGVIHEIDETPDARPYIAMVFHDGDTLARRVRGGALSVADAVIIGGQVSSALAAAHSIGVVHGDVKPSNVFLGADGQAMLVDFSIARIAGSDGTVRAGSGMFAYTSPEQLRGLASTRSDVWAFGAMLYEMLAGFRPFEGMTAEAFIRAVRARDMPSLEERRPDLPPALVALVARCLDADPAARPADGTALDLEMRAIEQALEQPGADPRPLVVSRGRATAAVAAAGALGMTFWLSCVR